MKRQVVGPVAADSQGALVGPTFGEAFRFWLRLGFISFGGPTAQIAIMHTELVDRRRWIDDGRFLHALNYCMLLPGPEAQQLAIYIGWLLHRTPGGLVAGTLFVLPSMIILWLLSYIYVTYGQVTWIQGAFGGLKPAVTAIVAAAVIRIAKKALKTQAMWIIAGAAFVAIFFLSVPFPIIVVAAALAGLIGGRYWPAQFPAASGHRAADPLHGSSSEREGRHFTHVRPTWARTIKVTLICAVIWWLPVMGVGAWQGWHSALAKEGIFFSKAAMVTFGGAYAVLPYVAQQAVERHAWLSATQMLDGLGLAETTPGPLIMVVQFVGFLGGWHHPGSLSPLAAATVGAALTTWVTFTPCFLWILVGAPFVEHMRSYRQLNSMLSTITAAVVGVVLNLATWFALKVWFPGRAADPDSVARAADPFTLMHLDGFALVVSLSALVLMVRFRWGMIPVLALASAAGVLYAWR